MIADVGSGFDIGQRLLTAVAKAADARGPETTLTKLVLAHLKLDAPMDLIGWTYKDLSWDRFAGLSQLVFTAAKEGDAVAVSIIDEAVKGLLESILVCYILLLQTPLLF
jgi:N-acetylglucosamine kinase-like BadF-type ATPase